MSGQPEKVGKTILILDRIYQGVSLRWVVQAIKMLHRLVVRNIYLKHQLSLKPKTLAKVISMLLVSMGMGDILEIFLLL